MATTWKRSPAIEGRISATNGLDVLDPRRVAVAIDRPAERGASWPIRIWFDDATEPVVISTFDRQHDAKRTADALLAATLVEDITPWNVSRRVREIEAAVYQADADADRAAYDARQEG